MHHLVYEMFWHLQEGEEGKERKEGKEKGKEA
jgi:hypothetical protein